MTLAIFKSNAVAAGESWVFPCMALLNHGCSSAFKVVYSWREKKEAQFVFALRDISKGDVGHISLLTVSFLIMDNIRNY